MVPFVPVGVDRRLVAATALSRFRGALRVTVVCKATFAFAPDGEMPLAPPVAIVPTDVHIAKNPMRSVRVSSDLSPHLERVDVMMVGRAHAPAGTKVDRMTVRLAILDDRVPVLDKSLAIVGDRDAPGAAPKPFDVMPLVYERAYGGLRFPENPLGVGIGGDGTVQPNVLDVDPSRPRAVAGFGPRSTSWLVRKKLLRGLPRPPVEEIAELGDDFDWIYFQAAPPDQWLDALPPRAWVVLEGLNARARTLRMRLPAMRVWARLDAPSSPGAPAPIELRADTLFIDGDAEHCTVAWRGSFTVAGVDALAGAWVAVAAEIQGKPLAWPERPPALAGAAASAGGAPTSRRALSPTGRRLPTRAMGGTISLDDLPPRDRGARPSRTGTGTMLVEDDAAASGAAKPGTAGTMILETPSGVLPDTEGRFGTMVVEHPPPAAQPLPFVGGGGARKRRDTPQPLPGAPWAPGAPVRVRRTPHPLAETQAPPSTLVPGAVAREVEKRRADQAKRADEAKRAEEAAAKEAARLRDEAEAAARRKAEREEEARLSAERFAKEQAAARKTAAEQKAAETAERAKGIKDLKKKAYGGFDD